MKHIQKFENFNSKDDVNEAEFSGRMLKAQKLIDLCNLVSQKFATNPDAVRQALVDHTMSYDTIKKLVASVEKV